MKGRLLGLIFFVVLILIVLIACQSSIQNDAGNVFTIEQISAKQVNDVKQIKAQKQTETYGQVANENFAYKTYTNTRFGFSVDIPTTFQGASPPSNNDGREFYHEDATIVAYASHINVNEDQETIETYYKQKLDGISVPIAYKRLADDWYVISYEEGNNIIYEKAIIGEDIISYVIITYPSSKKAYYDSMVTHVSKSFKGGQSEAEAQGKEETSGQEAEGNYSYKTYINNRFGFSVDIPTTFTMASPPTNNDGREFYNEDATILAYASHINVNEDQETIETYYKQKLDGISVPIAYKRLADDWYVISYEEGNNIIYEKAIIGESIICHVVITYPSSKKAYYDPMVNRVSKSFKGGQNELSW